MKSKEGEMGAIGGLEGKILKKYLKGQVIEEQDRFYLDRLANTGLIRYGFSPKEKKPTAKTTQLGYACIF
jgi:hypothetical protein